MEFIVIDNNTGEEPDTQQIVLKEQWADGLMYPDMDGFAIMENGDLILLDECGNFRYCPDGRFTVCFKDIEFEDFEEQKNELLNEATKEIKRYIDENKCKPYIFNTSTKNLFNED